MPKLEVKENKKLVLVNVLKVELRNLPIDDLDEEVKKFMKKIDLLKVQIFGPLVIRNIGTNIHEDGTMSVDYDIMIQASDYKQYKNEFIIEDRYECKHCLYLHYEGKQEDMSYAYMKLELFEYENDLVTTSELYTVYIKESEANVVIDLFKPMVFV